eukprot:gnl/Chilomastix_cuspidata/4881.p1 GENE.gnl/Chilomastix_cuspidata/4881~~gnl/Chilomastix_cuspidata/4881.p1  ORF type:complete len:399 (+),score=84.94 gnl/Chilomastix_cuspidata/4881:39-1235(+)
MARSSNSASHMSSSSSPRRSGGTLHEHILGVEPYRVALASDFIPVPGGKLHMQYMTPELLGVGQCSQMPVVLVHGAWTDNNIWKGNFITFLAVRGFSAHALSLPHHGQSVAAHKPRKNSVFACAEALAAALGHFASRFAVPPLLVTHADASLVVQTCLAGEGAPTVSGVVYVSPYPPPDATHIVRAIQRRNRCAYFRARFTGNTLPLVTPFERTVAHFLSPGSAADSYTALKESLQNEPPHYLRSIRRAGRRLALRPEGVTRKRRLVPQCPSLVVSGTRDATVSIEAQAAFAKAVRAQHIALPDVGHIVMLELQWPAAATNIIDWIVTKIDSPMTIPDTVPQSSSYDSHEGDSFEDSSHIPSATDEVDEPDSNGSFPLPSVPGGHVAHSDSPSQAPSE